VRFLPHRDAARLDAIAARVLDVVPVALLAVPREVDALLVGKRDDRRRAVVRIYE
jgi:hypothetical protein